MKAKGDADVELAVDAHCLLGESPVWDPRSRRLVWVDIRRGTLHSWAPSTSTSEKVVIGHSLSAVALRRSGGYALATRLGFACLEADGRFGMLAEVEADVLANRMNDGKCDPRGRFWAGTMADDHAAAAGTLYRLDVDGCVTKALRGVTVSNGLAWSGDERTMYYVDSHTHGLDAYDFDAETGELGTKRRVVDVDPSLGHPDGITVDEDGLIWVALHSGGAVHRYRPDGALDFRLELPVPIVTSCSFGGDDLKDLYITTAMSDDWGAEHAGGIFRYECRVAGMPAGWYEG
jgi:sugar lactone lactonase YvrE